MSDAIEPARNVEYGSRRPLRRQVVLKIDLRYLAELLQLPGDVHVTTVVINPLCDALDVLLTSDRFEERQLGMSPPELIGILLREQQQDGTERRRITWPDLE